jgi:hypothetical protein
MGLLIKLQNGDTQLKSLKFGSDRLGGGDSGQPYIQTSVDTEPGQDAGTDFLLRGGINAPADALTDVKRLTKYMFDKKSPSGGLFVAKQNLLSRVSPKTEASKGLGYAFGALNNGVYTPLSTLAQAGVGFLGGHVNKQGLDPTGLFPGLSINKYEKTAYDNNLEGDNRLVGLAELSLPKNQKSANNFGFVKGYGLNIGDDVVTYGGGPGSVLGVGKTHIRYAKDGNGASLRTGLNNVNLPNAFTTTEGYDNYSVFKNPRQVLWNGAKIFNGLTVSGKYETLTGIDPLNDEYSTTNNSTDLQLFPNSVYTSGSLDPFTNLSGPYGYLTERKSKKPTTEEDSYSFSSPIENILNKTYNRQLLSSPLFDKHGITNSNEGGLARTWGVTSKINDGEGFIGRYSSRNTLKRDFTDTQISGSYGNALWDNFNRYYGFQLGNVKHALKDGGYLADLDKNAGVWKEDGKTIGNHNNAYPGGIAPDFRLVPRKIRGLYPFLDGQKPTSFRKDNGKISQLDWDETSTTWIDEGGNLKSNTLDKIYYNSNQSSFRTSNPLDTENDLIKFRISIIDPTVPNKDPFQLNFRAYIDSFSDSYAADWKSQTYMGRGEKFYKYNSFERDISLAFTVVADNKANLNIMYKQLNRLAASLAPTYTGQGYMAGNLHKLTIGNYVYDQPGILTSLTYDITEESPWEIDKDNQLPFYIKVTGMKFIPIHTFRPEATFKPAGSDQNSVHDYINQPSS